jgi:hypothetical protein
VTGAEIDTDATRRLNMDAKHLGSDFDDFLREEGLLDDAEAAASKRVLAYQNSKAGRRGVPDRLGPSRDPTGEKEP